jgi:hypothetical protein
MQIPPPASLPPYKELMAMKLPSPGWMNGRASIPLNEIAEVPSFWSAAGFLYKGGEGFFAVLTRDALEEPWIIRLQAERPEIIEQLNQLNAGQLVAFLATWPESQGDSSEVVRLEAVAPVLPSDGSGWDSRRVQ